VRGRRHPTKTITVSLEIGIPMIRDYPVYDFKAVTRLIAKFRRRLEHIPF
jgi:hypothetical protein